MTDTPRPVAVFDPFAVGVTVDLPFVNLLDPPYSVLPGTDISAAYRAALASVSGGVSIKLPPSGTYYISPDSNGIGIGSTKSDVWITADGSGPDLIWVPTAHDQSAVKFFNGGNDIANCGMVGINIRTTNTTLRKTCFDLEGVTRFRMDNCIGGTPTNPFTDAGKLSKSLRLRGHDTSTISRYSFAGDTPISVEKNPFGLDFDVFRFIDGITFADSNPNVFIASGVDITRFILDDFTWVGGSHGFYYNDLVSTNQNFGCRISNGSWEQAQSAGWLVYFSRALNAQRGLWLEKLSAGAAVTQHGIYARLVSKLAIRDYDFSGTAGAVPLNIDTYDCSLENFNVNGLAKSMGTMVMLPGASQIPAFERWKAGPSTFPLPVSGGLTGVTGAVATLSGSDLAGVVQITPSATSAAAGTFTITFASAALYPAAPSVFVQVQDGTGTWNARASVKASATTTVITVTFDNNAVNLVNGSTYLVKFRVEAQ